MITRFLKRVREYYPVGQAPRVIFEVGSRDGLHAAEFAKNFPGARIYAFECNPETLPLCRRNTAAWPQIEIVPKAVHRTNGRCRFFPVDTRRSKTPIAGGNPGASSLFKWKGDYPGEDLVQNEIEVESTRLDTFCRAGGIAAIDLLWLDLQGAELMALESLGELIRSVKIIHTEAEFKPLYEGQALFPEIEKLLAAQGFVRHTAFKPGSWFADVVYLNERFLGPGRGLQVRVLRALHQAYLNLKYYILDPVTGRRRLKA